MGETRGNGKMRRDRQPAQASVLPLRQGVARGEAPPPRPRPPRPSWMARVRAHWPRYAVLAAALYGVGVGRQDVAEYLRLRRQVHALQARERAALRAQAALRAKIAYAKTNAFITAAARQRFGLVSPGEVPLAPIQPSPPAGAAQGANGGSAIP